MSDEQNVVRIDSGTARGTAEGDLVTFKGIRFWAAGRRMALAGAAAGHAVGRRS